MKTLLKKKIIHYTPYLITIIIAILLKQHYSLANCSELRWIMLPTTILVESVSGLDFIYNESLGFINELNRVIIAKSCAGVNYLIILFCVFSFSVLPKIKKFKNRILCIIISLTIAYCLTLFVNTSRILISIWSYNADLDFGWFTKDRIHRVEGIALYFISLLVFNAILQKHIANTSIIKDLKRIIKNSILPLSAYTVVMVLIPLIRGTFVNRSESFIEHIIFVITIPSILLMTITISYTLYTFIKKNSIKVGIIK